MTCADSASVWSTPTRSITASTPRPPVAARMVSAACSSLATVEVRAAFGRERESLRQVDGDDRRGCLQAQQLQREHAEPADPDHDDEAVVVDDRQDAVDDAVGEVAPASPSGAARRGSSSADQEHVARAGDHVRREAAVAARAVEARPVEAEVVVAGAAVAAGAAGAAGVDDDARAGLESVDGGADLDDPADVLVAERVRPMPRSELHAVVDDLQVGAADPRRLHLQQDLVGARGRNRHLPPLGSRSGCGDGVRPHRVGGHRLRPFCRRMKRSSDFA